ncbi:nicotinamide-nucleotide amidase [Arachidicoccus rhizosphaerae]|uniref:Nicotinamide-nucleotide amidase n=1 Tax=Arachidicoccus rhizosphaerae TaxID=551991 RepID=A0A1H3YYA0_9BACT|nr:CinA family protein [Arachidicoccus rhizosphaerae]SEA16563.1 nicotinamide-nucleotide amidase [Arachidicoccus rhizosphaerae]
MNQQPDKYQQLAEDCAKLLAQNHKKVAFAESATAGFLMACFSCCKHSEVLSGGIVCYDAAIKTSLLGVDQAVIDVYTAESIPVTEGIAKGLSNLINSDYYIGITGLLKPGGSETVDKPVGTMYVTIYEKDDKLTHKYIFSGSPENIRNECLARICMLLIEKITLSVL